jgi:hypothetical protein
MQSGQVAAPQQAYAVDSSQCRTACVILCADTILQCCLQDMTHPDEASALSTASGDYDSAFPNVGLIVWQAGFVLGE